MKINAFSFLFLLVTSLIYSIDIPRNKTYICLFANVHFWPKKRKKESKKEWNQTVYARCFNASITLVCILAYFFYDVFVFIYSTIQKFSVSRFCIQQRCITFILKLQKIHLKRFKTFELSNHHFHKMFSTLIIIRYVSWSANQHIRMISEGSCDTEDWSNDAENSALPSQK